MWVPYMVNLLSFFSKCILNLQLLLSKHNDFINTYWLSISLGTLQDVRCEAKITIYLLLIILLSQHLTIDLDVSCCLTNMLFKFLRNKVEDACKFYGEATASCTHDGNFAILLCDCYIIIGCKLLVDRVCKFSVQV